MVHLEQQLVLHDPLDRLDEQVVELQPVAQLLPELLTEDVKKKCDAFRTSYDMIYWSMTCL